MTHIEAEVGGVVVWLADVLAALEVVKHVGGGPVVDHLPLAQQDQAVEHAEHRVPAKTMVEGRLNGLLQEDPKARVCAWSISHLPVGPKEANRMADWTTIGTFHAPSLGPYRG